MTDKAYNPKPKAGTRCVICGEPVTGDQAFEASKPRRGSTIFVHKACLEQEQQEGDET